MDQLKNALKKVGFKSMEIKKSHILLQCDCGAILDKRGKCRNCSGPSELTKQANAILRKKVN